MQALQLYNLCYMQLILYYIFIQANHIENLVLLQEKETYNIQF